MKKSLLISVFATLAMMISLNALAGSKNAGIFDRAFSGFSVKG